ncbi:HypC/HybG/HupF family hydrogenase formation chaperone [Cohaesibacter gelatinilyticus]|jgi:hydrogenase expression/formation protein HypC|uniref:Hydrogenase maturation factor HypC n=1 Tax=Cohaesibacter gelatinilyticus TaxID=372072 RepID=A0A285PMT9_9HYPH|nr:HypC/HybG/HupF family hydrogenase formation chaperone [Cohaesibacter gelatinilyticus]SNZ21446.1 hydrogenase expression/formation protein HypC [Cohaesibacter gelatinilyticus]
MCLALPAELIAIDEASDMGTVSLEGVKKQISLALVDGVKVGDFVLVHVGYALNTISPSEAQKTLELMNEAGLVSADEEAAQ